MTSSGMYAKMTLKTNIDKLQGTIPASIVLNKHKTTIGRPSGSAPNDVVLSVVAGKNDIISRRHAEVTFTLDGQFVIRDLGALNGIFVNDRKIEMHVLQHNDLVQFGGICNAPLGTVLKGSNLCVQYVFCRDGTGAHTPHHEDRSAASATTASNRKPFSTETPRATSERGDVGTAKLSACTSAAETVRGRTGNRSGLQPPSQLQFLPDTPTAVAKNERANTATASAAALSAVASSLSCAICSLLLLDAVVCPCSHGFCRVCIETYHRSKALRRPACPICNIKPAPAQKPLRKAPAAAARAPDSDDEEDDVSARKTPIDARCDPLSVASGNATSKQVACYFRSSHLDSVVCAVVEASGPAAVEQFHDREKASRETLISYDIDPDAAVDFNYKYFRYCGEEGHNDKKCPHDDGRPKKRKRGYLSPPLRSPHFSDSDSTGECSTPSDSDSEDDALVEV